MNNLFREQNGQSDWTECKRNGVAEGEQVGRVRLHESMGWSLGFISSGKGYETIYLCIRKMILITV